MSHAIGGGGVLGILGAVAGAALTIATAGAASPLLVLEGAAIGGALGSTVGGAIGAKQASQSTSTSLPAPTATTPAPTTASAPVQQAATTVAQTDAKTFGPQSTILTSSQGAADSGASVKKTLLGS